MFRLLVGFWLFGGVVVGWLRFRSTGFARAHVRKDVFGAFLLGTFLFAVLVIAI